MGTVYYSEQLGDYFIAHNDNGDDESEYFDDDDFDFFDEDDGDTCDCPACAPELYDDAGGTRPSVPLD